MYCVHSRCRNNSRMGTENVAFFRFPKDLDQRKKWEQFCELSAEKPLAGSSRLCSLHFNPVEIYRSPKGKILRISSALPVNSDVPQLTTDKREAAYRNASGHSKSSESSRFQSNPDSEIYTDVDFLEDEIDDQQTLQALKEMQSVHDTHNIQPTLDLTPDKQANCKCTKLENQLSKSQAENVTLKRKLEELESSSNLTPLKQVLNPDQIRLMSGTVKKVKTWSNDSIVEGMQTRFACGTTGYEFIREKYRLPSTRSLQERLSRIHFDTGVLNDIYYFMKIKTKHINNEDKDCLIVLDEMAIEPGRQWCQANQKFYGNVSLPGHSGTATHLLIFMVVGIRSRWKQIVGFHFTGETIDNGCLKDILLDLIERTEDVGLQVHAIVTDCGSNNKKLWNDLGISHTQNSVLSNAPIMHPVDNSRKLEVMPDSVHVFKSMIHGWINNTIIKIPDEIVAQNGLVSNIADIRHITDLVKYEQRCQLKMTCGLQLSDVCFDKKMNNFDKMKVGNSTKYANGTVVAGLKFYAEQERRPEVLTTAFLMDQMVKWFKTMTSRSNKAALAKKNLDAYNQAVNQLKSFRKLIFDCKVGIKSYWKPWQSAVILATDSILRLQQYLIENKNYDFVLGGRFTQDCVENVFGQLRQKHKRPTALQAKNDLKLLTVSQYMNDVKNQSYDWDNPPWLLDFENDTKILATRNKEPDNANRSSYQDESVSSKNGEESEFSFIEADTKLIAEGGCSQLSEENVVYYIAGVILNSISKKCTSCKICFNSCVLEEPEKHDFSRYSMLKDFTGNSLVYANPDTYNFFLQLEGVFKLHIDQLLLVNDKINEKLYTLMQPIEAPHIPDCHTLKKKIIKRFIIFRLHATQIKYSRQKRFDSRSMYV